MGRSTLNQRYNLVGIGGADVAIEVVQLLELVIVENSYATELFLKDVVVDMVWLLDQAPVVAEGEEVSDLGGKGVQLQDVVDPFAF